MIDMSEWEHKYGASLEIFSALANPLRLAITHCLINHPHTTGELSEHLNASQPLISHHLKLLKEAHVVVGEAQGRKTLYSVADQHIRHIVLDVHEHAKENPS